MLTHESRAFTFPERLLSSTNSRKGFPNGQVRRVSVQLHSFFEQRELQLVAPGSIPVRATVQEVSWGGAASSSTPMQTRVTRCSSTAATGSSSLATTRVDQTIQVSSNAGNNDILLYSLSSTVLPSIAGMGALFGAAWNAKAAA